MNKPFKRFKEDIVIPIKIGDTIKTGKFKNKSTVVKKIGKNDKGDITVNDRPLLKVRLIKDNPQEGRNVKKKLTVRSPAAKLSRFKGVITKIKKDFTGEGRNYKKEYEKFQSSPERRAYRAQLVKFNRDKGTYGNKDGLDASHKDGKIVGFEDAKKNRGRIEKSRVKGYKEKVLKKIKEAPLVVVGDRKYRERVLSYMSDFIDKTKIGDIDKKVVKGVLKKKITHTGKSHKFEKKLK